MTTFDNGKTDRAFVYKNRCSQDRNVIEWNLEVYDTWHLFNFQHWVCYGAAISVAMSIRIMNDQTQASPIIQWMQTETYTNVSIIIMEINIHIQYICEPITNLSIFRDCYFSRILKIYQPFTCVCCIHITHSTKVFACT